MKKITALIIIICVFLSFNSISQITKGNWMVGGSASFSSTTFKSEAGQKNTAFSIQISPNIGYFIADKFSTGLKTSFSKYGTKSTGTSVYGTYTDANVGPFVRYYFMPVSKQINILVEGSYQYGYEGGGGKLYKHTFSLFTGPVVYFNNIAGLEFLIGYSTTKNNGYAGSDGTVQVGLGLQVHLEKDK